MHIGSHKDLSGRDRNLYRFFETLPGLLSWGTLVGVILLSWLFPIGIAIFIILFSLYWLLRTFYLMAHLRFNWVKMKRYLSMDWENRLENIKWQHVWQCVVLPMYNEPVEVVRETAEKLAATKWPKERMIVVLAIEERAGEHAEKVAEDIKFEYASAFGHFLITRHPAGLQGEIPGKGSNITWAAQKMKERIIDTLHIPYEHVLVSAFDIDTQIYPQYFLCLTYHFLTAEFPHRSSYQPVPVYNNNIWDAPFLSRVVATSNTFWQMMQQERPEQLVTFSSHSMSLQTLVEVGFWQKNIVSEDSRIFWNALLHYDTDYRVVPMSYPVSMDANVGYSFWDTVKKVYLQQRRWMWGAENIPYLLYGFLKKPHIPFRKKFYYIWVQLEGFWSLATNPLLIVFLGWLPLVIGGPEFNETLFSYNLPRVTQALMSLAMLGLVVAVVVSTSLLPPRPKEKSPVIWIFMVIQWILIPFTIIFFGSIPGLDAQTRLMLGKPLGFWVTPKQRKKDL